MDSAGIVRRLTPWRVEASPTYDHVMLKRLGWELLLVAILAGFCGSMYVIATLILYGRPW